MPSSAEAGPVEVTTRSHELRGSALARGVLRLCGWRLGWTGLPARQGVVVVYPHTSNWDFIWAILAKWGTGFQVTFWGKDTLFRIPLFGRWLYWLGGRPVDRSSPRGAVGQMAQALGEARANDEFMWLALSPEGTRSLTPGWRTGFYNVALQAQVPVLIAYIDYGRREVGFDTCWMLSGDRERDIALFNERLAHRRGYRAALASPIRFI